MSRPVCLLGSSTLTAVPLQPQEPRDGNMAAIDATKISMTSANSVSLSPWTASGLPCTTPRLFHDDDRDNMKKIRTSVAPGDYDGEDSDDSYSSGSEEEVAPTKSSERKKKNKVQKRRKAGCCKRCILSLEHRLVIGYHDIELDKIIKKYEIRDPHVSVRELSKFDDSHSIRGNTDANKDHYVRNSCCPLYPDGKVRAVIDFYLIVCVLLDALYIPFSVAYFTGGTTLWDSQLLAESIVDGIFLVDFFSHFFTAYKVSDGVFETRMIYIFWNYIKSPRCLLNLLCAFPFQLLEYFNQTGFTGYKLASMVRILRLYDLFPVVYRWLKHSILFDGFISALHYSQHSYMIKLLKETVLIIILLHFAGCWWIIVNRQFDPSAHDDWLSTNGLVMSGTYDGDTYSIYLLSVETVVNLVLGYNAATHSSNTMRANAVFLQLIGVFWVSYVFGQTVLMLTDLNARDAQFNRHMARLQQTMSYLRLPQSTQYRVRKYYEYLWTNFGGFDQNLASNLAGDVSGPLRAEISLYLHDKEMRDISVFKDVDHHVIKALIEEIRVAVYLPGDFVCRQGDAMQKLFIVIRGRCEVLGAEDQSIVVKRLKEGDHFGEVGLMDGRKCEASVVAMTYCNFNTLSKSSFDTIRKKHPEYGRALDKATIQQITMSPVKEQKVLS